MTRRYMIEIAASSGLELAEMLTRLAAHVLKTADATKPIKILNADGAIVASLEQEAERPSPKAASQ